jgi:hypothetical protein
MIRIFKRVGTLVGWGFVLLLTMASIASASEFGPRKKPGMRGREPVSVAEPAAILLLGAGLASLGLYAKKKRGKKQ